MLEGVVIRNSLKGSIKLFTTQFLHQSKFKAHAGDKIYVTQKLEIVLGWIENMFGKGAKCCFQQFFHRIKMFSEAPFLSIMW